MEEKQENIQLEHQEIERNKQRLPLCLLANDIFSPSNVGSFFRIADALGVEKIYLSGITPQPPNAKIRKTARSTEKVVPYLYQPDALEIIDTLKKDGYKIVALEITSISINIHDFKCSPSDKICLVVGAENTGVHPNILERADSTIHIPMLGQNSSMNVANACAIAVYELGKQFIGL